MTGMLHKSNPWQSLTDDNAWIIHIPSFMVDGLSKRVLQKFDATPCSNLTHQSLKWVLKKSSPDTKCQTPCPHLAPSNPICIHLSRAHWRPTTFWLQKHRWPYHHSPRKNDMAVSGSKTAPTGLTKGDCFAPATICVWRFTIKALRYSNGSNLDFVWRHLLIYFIDSVATSWQHNSPHIYEICITVYICTQKYN